MIKSCQILIAILLPLSVWAETSKPNVVFVLFDDIGYGQPPSYRENSPFKTPSLDRLAQQGMRFTDAHSTAANCTPTRYGVLTGRYPSRIGQFGVLKTYSKPIIPKKRLTVASFLKGQGYHTACIGKWNLGMNWVDVKKGKSEELPIGARMTDGPNALGFDYFYGFTHARNIGGIIEQDKVVANVKGIENQPMMIKKALEYLDERAKEDKPFFLYFPLPSPHTPVAPNKDFIGKSKAGKYGDFVFETDWVVGEVMKAIDDAGITADTLLIVTSDNGPERHMIKRKSEFKHFSAAGFRGCKRDNWEGGHRIPFIARWSGKIKPATTSDEIICLTDLTATAAAIVGINLPNNGAEDSYNILPALLGQPLNQPIREATIHHSSKGKFAIRQDQWVLLDHPGSGGNGYDVDTGEIQLYNLQTDASQEQNLADKNPDRVSNLKALLEKYKESGRSRP